MTCPRCQQPVQVIGAFTVCPTHGVVATVAATTGDGHPGGTGVASPDTAGPRDDGTALGRLIAAWPSVLALPLQAYAEEAHPVQKLWHACEVVESVLRFLVMAGVADAARRGEVAEPLARQLAAHIERPTLGDWRGMAEALARAPAPPKTLLPELAAYVTGVLVPLLDGASMPATAQTSLSRLRNRLAHASGMTRRQGAELLVTWRARFEAAMAQSAWLAEAVLVVRTRDGRVAALRGPTTEPVALADAAGPTPVTSEVPPAAVWLVRGGHTFPLWPLCLYGEPRPPAGDPSDLGEAPQVYSRRGEVRLEVHAARRRGGQRGGRRRGGAAAFQRLFQLESCSTNHKSRVSRFAGSSTSSARTRTGSWAARRKSRRWPRRWPPRRTA